MPVLFSADAKTRKILECAPGEKFGWRPHEKSATLGKLANHLAAMPIFAAAVVNGMANDAASNAEVLEALDKNVAAGREALAGATDDHLAATVPALNMTRLAVLRERMISHMIHHRGQLTVYLRLLDVAVPGMYGPSADEK
jgi:uncharacterized damage-inducible protein DinB